MDDIKAELRKLLQEHLEATRKMIDDAIRRELGVEIVVPSTACVYFDDDGNPWREATRADVGQFARFGDYGFDHAMEPPCFEGYLELSNNPHYPFHANGPNFRNAYIRIPRIAKG